MSINVRRGGPLEEPGPLARVVAAADPDIVLLQEWDQRGGRDTRSSPARAASLARWFDTHVPGGRPWRARRSQAHGVAIVARHEMSPLGPEQVLFPTPADGSGPTLRPVRYVAARVDTPLGPVAVASIHLSCCGAPGSMEDRERAAQATALHAAFRAAVARADVGMVVVGGDFNLVGEVHPRNVIAASLDLDGSALAVAPALAPGDRAATTWRDPHSRFSPSQLDFLLYSDATAVLQAAFVADTATMSETTLRRAGLLRDDAAFSDHLGVVIDLRRRDPRLAATGAREAAEH
nr:endonuclease/exonuclease/phosphatase family protein [Wenzhouxiangella sp. XN24]